MLTLTLRLAGYAIPFLTPLALAAPLAAQCPAETLFDANANTDLFGADVDLIADLAVIGDPLEEVLHVATKGGGTFGLSGTILPPVSGVRFGAQVELKYYDWDGAIPSPFYVPCSAEVYASAPDELGTGVLYRARGGSGACGWTLSSRAGSSLGNLTDPVLGAAKVGESLSSWGYRLAVGAPDNHGGRGSAYLLDDFFATAVSCADLYSAAAGPWFSSGTEHLGTSVAINERWALVGAPGEGAGTGFVWVFERVGGSWAYHSSIPTSLPGTRYGLRLALNDDSALVSYVSTSGYRTALYSYQSGSSWSLVTTLGAGLAGALTDDRAVLFEPPTGTVFICATVPVRPYYRKPDGSWVSGPTLTTVPYSSVSDLVCSAEISGETVLVGSKGEGCLFFPGEGVVKQRDLACFAGSGADCNGSGLPDAIDIHLGTSADCNDDGFPDECVAPLSVSTLVTPIEASICAGESAEITADGSGSLPMTFTWYEGPVVDPGKLITSGSTGGDGTGYSITQSGITSSLDISDFQQYAATAVTKTYTVVLESGGCSATTTVSIEGITPPIPPLLTVAGAPTCPDGTLTLSVPAIYNDYDWIHDGTWVASGSPTHTLDASTAPGIFGEYYVVVFGDGGCESISNTVTIDADDVLSAPLLSLAGSPSCPGQTALVLSVAEGYDTYAWEKDDMPIPGETSHELTLDTSDPAALYGSYTVTVESAGGSCQLESNAITVDGNDFIEVPEVTVDAPACEGTDLMLTAEAGYDSYQWVDESGATVGSLATLGVASPPAGSADVEYVVWVSRTGATCQVPSDPVAVGPDDFVASPEIAFGGSPACPGLTELILWVPDAYTSYLWYRDGQPVSGSAFSGLGTHELRLATAAPEDVLGRYTVVVTDANSGCSLLTAEEDAIDVGQADFLAQPCDVVISNGTVDLTVTPDPEYGLVTDHLVNLSVTGPAGPGDGVFFAPTDLWKITFRNRDFTDYEPPLWDPCDGGLSSDPCNPPADGLIHVRASDVAAMPTLSVGPDPLHPTELRARWQVHAGAIESIADADTGTFDLEPFEVEVIYETKGNNDFVGVRLNAKLTNTNTRLSIYRIELRTAAELTGTPQNQVLSMPWYFGVLVPDPLNAPELDLANCYADVRLSDPEHGKAVPTHPGVYSMQWMSYYQTEDAENDLLFWGTRDTGNHIKPYALYRETDAIGFGVQYQPPDNLTVTGQESEDGVTMPFEVVMTALKGDWYDAAQYYRQWAINPAWTWIPNAAPGEPGSSFSDAMFRAQALGTVALGNCAGGTTKDYSNFQYWSEEWAGYRSYFGLDPVHGLIGRPWFWDYNSFDAAFGDWFPTRTDFLGELQEVSYPWAPYFHPLIIDPDSTEAAASTIPEVSGEDLSNYVVRDEFGQPHEACIQAVPKTVGCSSTEVPFRQQVLCAAAVPAGLSPENTLPLLYSKSVLGRLDSDVKAWMGAMSGVYLDEYHHIERVCYADHGNPDAHPPGGDGSYFIDGKQALTVLLKQWMTTELGIAEPYLWIESASEPYVAFVEACNLSYGGIFGVALEAGSVRRAPLFQTVYNEFQRFPSVLPVNLPLPFSAPDYPKNMAISRHHLARFSYESGEIPLGTVLEPSLLADKLSDGPYSMAVNMVRDISEELKTDEARDLMRFGQRFRDPAVASVFVPPSGGGVPVALQEEDEDLTFPPVYASACGRAGERIGVLLVNWTAVTDLLVAPGLIESSLPGDQRVTVTLEPESYGFAPAATLSLRDVKTGVTTTVPWGGGDLTLTRDLPELSGTLLVLEP
ncbi:MAG: hypothetical protein AAF682_11615 [Planctomycetota bacterium]